MAPLPGYRNKWRGFLSFLPPPCPWSSSLTLVSAFSCIVFVGHCSLPHSFPHSRHLRNSRYSLCLRQTLQYTSQWQTTKATVLMQTDVNAASLLPHLFYCVPYCACLWNCHSEPLVLVTDFNNNSDAVDSTEPCRDQQKKHKNADVVDPCIDPHNPMFLLPQLKKRRH